MCRHAGKETVPDLISHELTDSTLASDTRNTKLLTRDHLLEVWHVILSNGQSLCLSLVSCKAFIATYSRIFLTTYLMPRDVYLADNNLSDVSLSDVCLSDVSLSDVLSL